MTLADEIDDLADLCVCGVSRGSHDFKPVDPIPAVEWGACFGGGNHGACRCKKFRLAEKAKVSRG